MTSQDSLIDYDQHPVFNSPVNCWSFDQKMLDKFNCLYKNLENGTLCDDPSDLLAIHKVIFDSFRVPTNNLLDDAFISELQEAVNQMIKSHIKFFATRTKHLTINPIDSRTIQKSVIKGEFNSLSLFKIKKLTNLATQNLIVASKQGKSDRESLSQNSGSQIRRLVKVLNSEFKRNGVLNKLSGVYPGPIKVIGAAIELSVPNSRWWTHSDDGINAPTTLYAHIDEGIEFPKAIIYLTNVNADNGPFSYFPCIFDTLCLSPYQSLIGRCITNVGSSKNSVLYQVYGSSVRRSSSTQFRRHFMKLPPEFRFNSHFGWDVISGSSFETLMKEDEIVVVGKAGTFIVFDGAQIVHRGGIVQNDSRLVVQVIFGASGLKVSLVRILKFLRMQLTL